MTKTTKITIGIIIVIIVIGGIWYEISKKPSEEVVKIGVILPLTGKYISYGERTAKGIDLAVEEVNKDEEIIQIIYENSEGDSTKGVTAAHRLIDVERVPVLITQLSGVSSAIAPIAQEKKVVLFGLTLTPGFTEIGDYIFRNRGDAVEEGKVIGEFALNHEYKKVAVLYKNNPTGIGEAEGFKEVFEKGGGEIVFFEAYEKGEKDFRTALLKIKEANPELIVASSRDKELPLILKQALELGLNQQFFSTQGIDSESFLETAGSLAEGLIYTRAVVYEDSAEPAVQAALKAYRERYNENMNLYAADAYDVIKILGQVIKNGARTSEEIKNALMLVKDFPGVSGPITFNEVGDCPKEYKLFTVKNGEFVPYEEGSE